MSGFSPVAGVVFCPVPSGKFPGLRLSKSISVVTARGLEASQRGSGAAVVSQKDS